MDPPYSPGLRFMDAPNTPNIGLDQSPNPGNGQSIPTFTFYSSRTPYVGDQNNNNQPLEQLQPDRSVSPTLMYQPHSYAYNQFPFNNNFMEASSPSAMAHQTSYNPLDIQFTSEFMSHSQNMPSPPSFYQVAPSAPTMYAQPSPLYQTSNQNSISATTNPNVPNLHVMIPPPTVSTISSISAKHNKRTVVDLEQGSSSIKKESVTIASFEAPVFDPPPSSAHYGHSPAQNRGLFESPPIIGPRTSPPMIRPVSTDSTSNSSVSSRSSGDSNQQYSGVSMPPPAKHIRPSSPPSRSSATSRSSRRGRAAGQPQQRQRYDSLEERQIHRKQKHREMDALRRQKETAVVERFALLSNQLEEKLEEKRDRVTTLEVACDRYADLIEQFEEQRKQLLASQEQCKKLEAQLALTRGVAFDSNFESLMSAHELGTMNDINARENSLIVSTLKACPPVVQSARDSVSPTARQQNLLDRMTSYYHSHALYSSIFWNSSMMIMVLSLSSARFLDCSQAFLDRAGWSRENVIGKVFHGVWSVLNGLCPLPSVQYDFADRPPMRTQEGTIVPAPFFSDQLAGTKKEIGRLWRGEAECVSCVFRMFFSMGSYEVRVKCWLGQGGDEVDVPDPSPDSVLGTSGSSSAGLDHDLQRMMQVKTRKRKMPLELVMATSSVDIVEMS